MSGGALMVPAPGVTDLDGNQVMMAIGEPTEPRLFGPDLRKLPSLSDQLDALDRVRATGDLGDYVAAWLATSDALGSGASAFWDRDAGPVEPARITTGWHCDDQEVHRRLRWQAMRDHCDGIEGFRAQAERELLLRRRYADNRSAPLWEVKAVVRAFLATGGGLIMRVQDREPSARTIRPRVELRFDWQEISEDEAGLPFVAATAMARLLRRHKATRALHRIVATLGVEHNGWFVLALSRESDHA